MQAKRLLLLCILLLGATLGLSAQTSAWMWVKQAGGSGIDNGYRIVTDDLGYIYVCGSFMGTANFGGFSLTSSAASHDIFVAKLDTAGNWLWVSQAGGTTDDRGRDLALDNNGNIYLTGGFTGTATFGSTSLTNSGYPDIFVAKLNNQGNWLWAQKAGGTDWDEGYGIAVDASGTSYVTGFFRAVATFGNLSMESVDYSYDVFVAKIDTSGEWIWAAEGGGSGYDTGYDIALGDEGYAYITGNLEGSANFGPNTITAYGANPDIFVCRISTAGVWFWAEHAGSTGYDGGVAITADSEGNSFVTGYFSGSATFGSHNLSTSSDTQSFVAKLHNSGAWQWAQQPGGVSGGGGNDVVLDSSGNIYVTGVFTGNPIFGTSSLTGMGMTDVYAAKMDAPGNWLWGQKAGGTGEDIGWGIAVNGQGNSFVTGNFTNYATFGTISYNYFGFSDIFIGKITVSGVPVDDAANIPTIQAAFSAQPNPFSHTTCISLKSSNADGGWISGIAGAVSVYDLRGRLVNRLTASGSSPATTVFTWDGKDAHGAACPSGIYHVRYSVAGKADQVLRITLLR